MDETLGFSFWGPTAHAQVSEKVRQPLSTGKNRRDHGESFPGLTGVPNVCSSGRPVRPRLSCILPYELLHVSGLWDSAPIVGGEAGVKQLVGLPEPRHQWLKHEALPADA